MRIGRISTPLRPSPPIRSRFWAAGFAPAWERIGGGSTFSPEAGGGAISPLLANVWIHYVSDLWIDDWRKQPDRGDPVAVPTPTISSSGSSTNGRPGNAWRRALGRRSSTDRSTWQRPYRLAERRLPTPRVRHPHPAQRLSV